jgi:CubicO group peptidase (beta-lactamase class C family)
MQAGRIERRRRGTSLIAVGALACLAGAGTASAAVDGAASSGTASSGAAKLPIDASTAPLGGPLQVLLPEYRLGSFTHMAQILPARPIARGGPVRELPRAARDDLTGVVYEREPGDPATRETLGGWMERTSVMAMVVLKDGRIVFERYRQGTDERTPFVSWSIAKSVVGTLVGVARQDGFVGDLSDPLVRYLPELATSGYAPNSLRDLLTMSSGVKFVEDYAARDSIEARSWIEGTVTRTVPSYTDTFLWFKERVAPPGKRFYYASIEPAILGWVLTRATARTLADYFSDKVWQHLGAEHDASWVLDRPGGIEIGSCCINASARDYARFGQMILDGGRVGDRQVVPAAWIRASTTLDPARPDLSPAKRLNGKPFGYQNYWWLWPAEDRAVSAHGAHGQQITVDFDDRVVIVQTANWPAAVDPVLIGDTQRLQAALVAALRPQPAARADVAAPVAAEGTDGARSARVARAPEAHAGRAPQ